MKVLKFSLAFIGMIIFLSCSSTRYYPAVFVQDTYYCFSSIEPVSEFGISPYFAKNDIISAKIIENDMALNFVPATTYSFSDRKQNQEHLR